MRESGSEFRIHRAACAAKKQITFMNPKELIVWPAEPGRQAGKLPFYIIYCTIFRFLLLFAT